MQFACTTKPNRSPWGFIQSAEQVKPGLWFVETASHGGFIISPERQAYLPVAVQTFKHVRADWPRAFEEDCEAALIVVAFKDEFGSNEVDRAKDAVRYWYPEIATSLDC